MFATIKIFRKLAAKKLSKAKKAEKGPQQVEVTKQTTKSADSERDSNLVQTIEVPHRSSSLPNASKPATGEPAVLRKEKHLSHPGMQEQQPSCRMGLERPVAEGGSSFTMPSRAPPASFPNPRTPGCEHHNTTLISTDMVGKSMASFRARWVFSDGTSTTHTREAAPFSPIMACPTSPFHGFDPLIPGTTIVNTSVISTDEAGNSTLRCRTICMLLDGTSKTQTRDPVFIPASADKAGDPSPLSHATPAEGASSFNGSSSGESPSIELPSSHTSEEPANPQTQPTPRQPRTFYRQPWSNASVAPRRPVLSIPPPLPRRKTIVRKPKFSNLTPRTEEDRRLADEAWKVLLNPPKVRPSFDILVAFDGSVEERPEAEGEKTQKDESKAVQGQAREEVAT